MKKIIIGALVLLIGIPGFSFTFFNLLNFLTGLVPVLMILGGAIAIYLGIEELKQTDTKATQVEPPETQPEEDIKEDAGHSEAQRESVLDKQEDSKPVPETAETTEEAPTNTPDEQPEPETQQNSECPSTLPGQPAELVAAEAEMPAGESVQFKGNIETLVFHDVACNFASGKNCSMDFATKEEAESQGYKPCKICMAET